VVKIYGFCIQHPIRQPSHFGVRWDLRRRQHKAGRRSRLRKPNPIPRPFSQEYRRFRLSGRLDGQPLSYGNQSINTLNTTTYAFAKNNKQLHVINTNFLI
jgi:hypothetical protein